METVANQTDLSAIFNFLEPLDDSLLHTAAFYDKHSILRLLLDYVPDHLLAAQATGGNTPLIVAISNKSSRTAAMLIRRISDLPVEAKNHILRKPNNIGNNALHMAVRRLFVKAVRLLLNEDMELVYQKNADQKSPLYLALEFEEPKIYEVLYSLPLEPLRIQGLPPIHGAIMLNRYDFATRILEKDVKLFAMTNSRGSNVFHLAAYMNRPRVFELLSPKIEYLGQKWDMNGEEPIHIASKMGYVDIVKKLCKITKMFTKQGETGLHIAAKYGRTSVVRYMLRHQGMCSLINEGDNAGNTALHMDAMHSQPATLIPLMLDERIDPFLLNHQFSTALDIALDRVKREYTLRKVGNMNNHYFIYECTGNYID
ncbi:hypothetical protein EUGRSUZ_L02220 [Eucalyptus grandis]|uniref:Uncharacterized protein n=1 Tax=Eucalyptus grandis TaxID=71139 RepID=A0A058ZTG4_EUCGR|nr:hypothetical protein EUGRSUZ_L02220 [Eucalyptus grandis]